MQLQRFAARSTAVKKMAKPLQIAKCFLWFNKTKREKRVQRPYRTEFGGDPLFKPSIHAFCKQFYVTRSLRKENVPSAAKCMAGTGIPTLCIQGYRQCTYKTPRSC
jgi:hypothetical protein